MRKGNHGIFKLIIYDKTIKSYCANELGFTISRFKKNEKEEEELTIDINNYIVWFTQGY